MKEQWLEADFQQMASGRKLEAFFQEQLQRLGVDAPLGTRLRAELSPDQRILRIAVAVPDPAQEEESAVAFIPGVRSRKGGLAD